MHKFAVFPVFVVIACILLPLPVLSQDSGRSAAAIEEIIVTARKREESLQEVPIAITAITGDQIRSQAISQMELLSQTVPNLFIAENTGSDLVGIRGIHSGNNFGFEQTVGQVFNGFFYGKSRLTRLPFLDVQRIEVLKGPQGSLIGKNTTAGAINITSAKPTDDFEAWGKVGYETFDGAGDGVTLEGAVSGPLADGLKGRVALRYEDGGGWVKNLTTGNDVPDKDDFMIRTMADWDVTADINLAVEWTRADLSRAGQSKQLAFCSAGMVNFLSANSIRTDDCGGPDNRTISAAPIDGEGNFEQFSTELDMVGLTINWQIGEHTLTSLTGFARYDSLDRSEGDRTPLEILNTRLAEDYEQWTQEIRFASPTDGRFEYLGGFYYQHQENSSTFGLDIDLRPLVPTVFPPPVLGMFPNMGVFSNNSLTDEEGDTIAVFGQITWNVTDQWSVTFDGRYTHEEKDATQTAFVGLIRSTEEVLVPLHFIEGERTEDNFSPAVTLKWSPDENMNYYASFRRGFKGGGFNHGNLDPQATVASNFEFEDEEVDAYELGGKVTFADGRAQLNVALFYQDYDDLQVSAIDNTQGLAITRITNAASAESKGVEAELTWLPIENLRLFASAAYNSAEFQSFDKAECFAGQTAEQGCITDPITGGMSQSLNGRQIENAPEWSGVFNGEYTWNIMGDYGLTVFGQAIFRDGFFTVPNHQPETFQDSYWKFDARATFGPASRKWELSFVAKNISDKFTSSFGNRVPGFMPFAFQPFVDPGRSFVVQGSVRF